MTKKTSYTLAVVTSTALMLIALLIAFSTSMVSAAPGVVSLEQGFGTNPMVASATAADANSWGFTPTVSGYSVPTGAYNNSGTTTPGGGDYNLFDSVESVNGNMPSAGNWLWGMVDLASIEEIDGMNIFEHHLAFDQVTIPDGECATLTFDYFAEGYDAFSGISGVNNQMKWSISENGATPTETILLDQANAAPWSSVTANYAGPVTLDLILIAQQNGNSGRSGWDNVKIDTVDCSVLAVGMSGISADSSTSNIVAAAVTMLAGMTLYTVAASRKRQS